MSKKNICLIILALCCILAFAGCRNVFYGDYPDDFVPWQSFISGTVTKGIVAVAMRAAGNLPVEGARVWLEERPDLFAITDSEGKYQINGIPKGIFKVVARFYQGGAIYKMRSVDTTLDTNAIGIVDLAVLEAKNVVEGVIKNEDGSFPPAGTKLWLWGEEFELLADGKFVTPPLPDFGVEGAINEIVLNFGLPTEFRLPVAFVSADQPLKVEFFIPGSSSSASQMPKVTLLAIANDKVITEVDHSNTVKIKALVSPGDATDIVWAADIGVISNDTIVKDNYREKTWTAPSRAGKATISVTVTNAGKTSKAQLTILVKGNQTYSVTYDGNGNTSGNVPADSEVYQQGQTVTPLSNTGNLIKTGQTFSGWNTAADGSGISYSGGSTFAMGSTNVTLYAKWTLNSYAVTFNSNGGSTVVTQTVDHDGKATLPTAPTRTGYTFAGWYKEAVLKTQWNFATDTVTSATTIFAKWTLNSYAVTFNSNGGSAVDPQTIDHDGKATLPTAPTRTGYTFAGWYKEAVLTTQWNFATDTVTSATTIFAKWTLNSYSVTFNSNGGSAVVTQTVDHDGKATLPTAPTRTGYTFAGWYKETGLTTQWNFATDTITSATTIFAKWTLNSYAVTFNSNGGSTVTEQTVDHDGKATLPTAPTRTGYTFTGWYKEAGLTTQWNFATDTVTSATTIFAKWTLNSYAVTFNSNGGSAVVTQTVDHDGKATLPTAPTRTGYTFAGWYKETGLTTQWNFATDTITSATTIFAKWTLNSYAVTFNSNGGSAVVTQTVDHDGKATLPTAPTRTGYTFAGWYKEAGLTTQWNFATDTITSGTTIFAKWTLNSYAVTFNSNGGSAVVTQTVDHDGKATLPTAPTRTGYTFAGWYKEAGLTTQWNFATDTITSATTIFAKWTLNSYTVTFNSNGGSAVVTQTVDHDGKATLPTAPTRTGYTFAGWYKEAGLTTQWNFATDTVTSTTTIFAKWTLNSYAVTFNSNGGSAVVTQTIDHDGKATLPTAPTRTGYTFAGWYKEAGLTTQWNFATDTITSATTIFAKWLNSTRQIVSFAFRTVDNAAITSDVNGLIDHNDRTVRLTVPADTNVSALKAAFTISNQATAKISSVIQTSPSSASNFNHPVVFTITAEDTSTSDYTVYVAQEWKTSGAVYSYVVPAAVTSLKVVAWGAEGGWFYGQEGAKGAQVDSTISVTPGETLQIRIGGIGGPGHATPSITGSGGWNGGGNAGPVGVNGGAGGGGGATDLRKSPFNTGDRLVVAGGAGGKGAYMGGVGGQNGASGSGTIAAPGGSGASQTNTGAATTGATAQNGFAGIGETGGAGGGAGGHRYSGGGGGGGYFGGGGAGCEWNSSGGGGGGGSSFGPAATVFISGVNAGNSGNGKLTITPLN